MVSSQRGEGASYKAKVVKNKPFSILPPTDCNALTDDHHVYSQLVWLLACVIIMQHPFNHGDYYTPCGYWKHLLACRPRYQHDLSFIIRWPRLHQQQQPLHAWRNPVDFDSRAYSPETEYDVITKFSTCYKFLFNSHSTKAVVCD